MARGFRALPRLGVFGGRVTPDELRAARAKLGLTQLALARALGVTQVTVARWETGVLPIDKRTAMAVAHLACQCRRA
jgi:transcriptional regulator with XRE-family HTH domain